MKRTVVLVALLVVAGLVAGIAQGQCCAGGKKADKAAMAEGGCPMTKICGQMNLTAEQKTKIEALKAEIMKESMEKCMKGMEAILTPEEFAQFREECKKSCAKACPVAPKTEEPAKEQK